ncbi:MAG: transcriptional regulator [Anaerolineaceae bacterium]|nr:transcriptional regulator [Anaerolineaceae bacterium]
MTKRSYHQYCPLAYSLDVIGERWTLLIVRDLLFGPRRYTDLLNGLPGIGTNLLAKRLKELEQSGIIAQRTLPPPASSTVYELTERGRGLQDTIMGLVRWGMTYVEMPPPEDDFMGTVPAMHAFNLLFDRTNSSHTDMVCEVRVDHEIFHAELRDGQLKVRPGPAEQPDLIISGPIKGIIQSILCASVAENDVWIRQGSPDQFEQFAAAFQFPTA